MGVRYGVKGQFVMMEEQHCFRVHRTIRKMSPKVSVVVVLDD